MMCQRAAKHAKIRPYRVTAVHKLTGPDKIKPVNNCNWFLRLVERNPEILTMTWFTDEAWFHLSGYVNSQNMRIWASENPHAFNETPIHPQKVGVWCAISAQRVNGPIFFEQTVNSEVYKDIFMAFMEKLDDIELTQGYFQLDGATCHTSNESMALINSSFVDRVILNNLWPPRSPDVMSREFYIYIDTHTRARTHAHARTHTRTHLFWDITLCSPLKVIRCFGGTCPLHLQG
jgi:hypothetical protein